MVISMANTCNFYTFYVCPNSRCIYLQCNRHSIENIRHGQVGMSKMAHNRWTSFMNVPKGKLKMKMKMKHTFTMLLPYYLFLFFATCIASQSNAFKVQTSCTRNINRPGNSRFHTHLLHKSIRNKRWLMYNQIVIFFSLFVVPIYP